MQKILFSKNTNILDPLSCIIYLSILGFKKNGTKLSIKNSTIELQEPFVTQGITRWINSDIRDDISDLCNPIEKAIEWYNDNENSKKIFEYSIKGLDKLISCYEIEDSNSTIIHSLLHYKNLISKSLENNLNILEESRTLQKNSDTLEKFQIFKNIWNNNDIECIVKMIENINECLDSNNYYDYYLNAIEEILKGKNYIKNKLIENIINL